MNRALEVRCPTCGAPAGAGCLSVMGKNPCRKPHRQRETAARQDGRHLRQWRKRRPRVIPEPVRIAVFARALGQCEVAPLRPALRCSGVMHLHHVLPRSAGGRDTELNLLYVCSAHHRHLHANPTWAYEAGLLRRRTGKVA